MKTAMVIFNVGVAHPLYNKSVKAEIITKNGGYNGKQIYAKTIEEVYYPEDKCGLLVYKNGKFVGYETRPAYSEIWEGWVEQIVK